jgi:hypothetical protein
MIFILLIFVLAIALPLGYHKYMGVRAMSPVYIDVSGLTAEQIVDIGTKASTPAVKRLLGRPQSYPSEEGGIRWDVGGRGGVMSFLVTALPDGGFRVTGRATAVMTAHAPGGINLDTTWGRSKMWSLLICKILGIPHNARQLLRRRRRALRAIAGAGQVIPLVPSASSQPPTAVPGPHQ